MGNSPNTSDSSGSSSTRVELEQVFNWIETAKKNCYKHTQSAAMLAAMISVCGLLMPILAYSQSGFTTGISVFDSDMFPKLNWFTVVVIILVGSYSGYVLYRLPALIKEGYQEAQEALSLKPLKKLITARTNFEAVSKQVLGKVLDQGNEKQSDIFRDFLFFSGCHLDTIRRTTGTSDIPLRIEVFQAQLVFKTRSFYNQSDWVYLGLGCLTIVLIAIFIPFLPYFLTIGSRCLKGLGRMTAICDRLLLDQD